MAEYNELDPTPPNCLACEHLLTDALDDTLTPASRAWFDAHLDTCAHCSDMFADATRGHAWLELLKSPRPEPPTALLDRILAQTTGDAAQQGQTAMPHLVPAIPVLQTSVHDAWPVPSNVLPFRPVPVLTRVTRAFFEPRLMMTAAMAFFSLALTMNLTGVRMSQLKPSNLRHTYYSAGAEGMRYYDNLRVVHVLQSRVDDLRDATRTEDQSAPAGTPNDPPKDTRDDNHHGVSQHDQTTMMNKEGGLA